MPKDFMVCCGVAALIIALVMLIPKLIVPVLMWVAAILLFALLSVFAGFILYTVWLIVSGQTNKFEDW